MNAGVLQVVGILHHQPLFKYIHAHMPLMYIGHKTWSRVHLWETICGKPELWWYYHSQEGQQLNSNSKVKLRMLWHSKCCAVLLRAVFCSTPHGIDPPHTECLALPVFRCSLQNWAVHPDCVWLMWELEQLSTICLRALLFLPPKWENKTALPWLWAQLWV